MVIISSGKSLVKCFQWCSLRFFYLATWKILIGSERPRGNSRLVAIMHLESHEGLPTIDLLPRLNLDWHGDFGTMNLRNLVSHQSRWGIRYYLSRKIPINSKCYLSILHRAIQVINLFLVCNIECHRVLTLRTCYSLPDVDLDRKLLISTIMELWEEY